MLVIPVIALFFTEHGLSLTQISLLQSIFSVALFSLEIPTWYISDRFGRKASLLCGNILIMLWYLVYRKMSTFRWFAWAEIILALGRACISGSDSALLYDTLKQAWKEAQAKKREWRIGFAGDIAGVLWGGIGWFLGYYFGFDILWLFSAMFVAITIPITRSLEEIRGEEHQHKEYHIINDAKQLYTQFRTKPRILWLILFTWILSYATYSLVRSQQQRLQQLWAPVARFGIYLGYSQVMCRLMMN